MPLHRPLVRRQGRGWETSPQKSHHEAGAIYGLNCVAPNLHVEALTLNATVFGGRACKEVITSKVK